MKSSRLKFFNGCLVVLAVGVLALQFFNPTGADRSALRWFGLSLILMGSGLELVRVELAELRRAISAGEGVQSKQSGVNNIE